MKIYVASSWRNEFQPRVVTFLLQDGHAVITSVLAEEVYDYRNPEPDNNGFSWDQIEPGWREWSPVQYRNALANPVAVRGFGLDLKAMLWADACVLVLPSGTDSHIEAGWFVGQGKPVLCLLEHRNGEQGLMRSLFGLNNLCVSYKELDRRLKSIEVELDDAAWVEMPDEDQRSELMRLIEQLKPCSQCGGAGLVFNTLLSDPFSNWFRVECYEGRGGCGRTTSKRKGRSGLMAVIEEWNKG